MKRHDSCDTAASCERMTALEPGQFQRPGSQGICACVAPITPVLCTPRFMECKCQRSGSQQPGKIALECQRPGVLTVGPELSLQIAPASLQHDTWQLAWEASMTSTMRPIDVTEPAAPKGTAVLGESEPSGMCGAEFMEHECERVQGRRSQCPDCSSARQFLRIVDRGRCACQSLADALLITRYESRYTEAGISRGRVAGCVPAHLGLFTDR